MLKSIKDHGVNGNVRANTAASDAYMYNNMADIPIVTFGAKPQGVSHQKDERAEIDSIIKSAEILVDFIDDFLRFIKYSEYSLMVMFYCIKQARLIVRLRII